MPHLEEKAAPRLFISYSHDSAEHEDRVLALADRLRHDGVDALIDQYDTAPPDGWPMWMDREIQKADFVAMVCTETYLRRVEGRESAAKGRGVLWEAKLIYNSLYLEDNKVQRFIPVLVAGGRSSFIPLPIRGSSYYQVDSAEGYEDFYRHLTGQPRHGKPAVGKLKALPAIAAQSYPASLGIRVERKRSTSLDERNRLQMLKRVRLDWIDGVLKQSLYQIARIEFGLQTKFDAAEQPLKTVVQMPDRPPATVPTGVSISQVFDDHGGALLILGAPGTGKTTLLLELAQELLDRAERDENHPIPVVFNLSSWAVRRQPLERWLVDELNERSDVPKRLAQQWVESEQVLPLLDGLDEVAVDHRRACAEAINKFRRDHGLMQIAVCSRIADYETLGTKLRLRSAVVVQPLTPTDVLGYLERIGEPAHGVRAALKEDPRFWEILETPLMLWVAMLAYREAPVELLTECTFEQRRRQLFTSFVDAMFKRRSGETRYTQQQTLSWLGWLARALTGNEQTVFYLESLREEWLPTRRERWLAKAGIILACAVVGGLVFGPIFGLIFVPIGWLIEELALGLTFGLIEGPIFGLVFGPRLIVGLIFVPIFVPNGWLIKELASGLTFGLIEGPIFGLVFGLIFGLICGLSLVLTNLRSVEILGFSFANARPRMAKAMLDGLSYGLICGLIFALSLGMISELISELILGLIFGQSLGQSLGLSDWLLVLSLGLIAWVRFWVIIGVILGPGVGLGVGLLRLMTTEVESSRTPNRGTADSIKNAFLGLLIGGLGLVLIGVLLGALTSLEVFGQLEGMLLDWLSFGMAAGMVMGYMGGGLFAIRHWVLRLALWMRGSAPLNYVPFLDYAVDRLVLRKVGGGYIFLHRMLLEYFATLADLPDSRE